MYTHYIVAALFFVCGTLSLLASLLGWSWFFETNNVRPFVKWFGKGGARLFYAIVGCGMLWASYTIFSETFATS